ncbi:DciA family protein [Mitsuokella jalaludinii]|uniref:DUF721 domain-containing protein n=1 Tax=Mitsuokella jalaludinii TaxID=187979 RepID=UPI003F9E259B
MARRTPGLEHTATIIPKAIHALGPKQEKEFYIHWALWHWVDIAGDAIARHIQVMGIRNKVLYVACDDAVWAQEIRMMMPRIVQTVNNYAGQALIKELHFVKKWAKPAVPDRSSGGVWLASDAGEDELDVGRERRKMPLTQRDEESVQSMAAGLEDEELAMTVRALYRKQRQLDQLRVREHWHPCAACGRLCAPERPLCPACWQKEQETLRARIRGVLRDIPWARYAEVSEYVPDCTTKLLNEQRALLVQQMAANIDVTDTKSIEAKNLVMLYRCLPPERLTEDVMKRAMYELRFNLRRPKDYKAPKRYEVIPLRHASHGRKAGAASRGQTSREQEDV